MLSHANTHREQGRKRKKTRGALEAEAAPQRLRDRLKFSFAASLKRPSFEAKLQLGGDFRVGLGWDGLLAREGCEHI